MKIIPKSLPGGVYPHYVLHKLSGKRYQYWRRQWRAGGTLRRQYVRLKDVEAVGAACAAHRQERIKAREDMQLFRELLKELRARGL